MKSIRKINNRRIKNKTKKNLYKISGGRPVYSIRDAGCKNVYVQNNSDCCFWAIRIAYEYINSSKIPERKWNNFIEPRAEAGIEDLDEVIYDINNELPEYNINYERPDDEAVWNIESIKYYIDEGYAVILKCANMTWWDSIEDEESPFYADSLNQVINDYNSNHCICCIGYDDYNGVLICRDSNINFRELNDWRTDRDDKIIKKTIKTKRSGLHNVKTISYDLVDTGYNDYFDVAQYGLRSRKYKRWQANTFHISDICLIW